MPSRSLIKEGIVDCPNSDGQARKRFFVVFNDMMIMAKIDGDKYKMMHMISYDKASVSSDETVTKIDISVDNKKLAEISFDSSKTGTESGASWLKALQQAISEFTAQKTRINDAKARSHDHSLAGSPGGRTPSLLGSESSSHELDISKMVFTISETSLITEDVEIEHNTETPILRDENSNLLLESPTIPRPIERPQSGILHLANKNEIVPPTVEFPIIPENIVQRQTGILPLATKIENFSSVIPPIPTIVDEKKLLLMPAKFASSEFIFLVLLFVIMVLSEGIRPVLVFTVVSYLLRIAAV